MGSARARRLWMTACLCTGAALAGNGSGSGDVNAANQGATTALDPLLAARVDEVVTEWLASTAAPSASLAIVQHGALVYAKAYGLAGVAPARAATPASRYALDSVTKEFTATAILLLAEQNKLSLDDPLRRWFPDLGPAGAVTLRQALTHTGGLRDYWPQDFVPPEMLRPTTTASIIQEWAQRPLDFEPGSEWQYSNTGYVLAAAVVEQVSGQPYLEFLRQHVFAPLQMTRVSEATLPVGADDAEPYTRYGLGPLHAAPKEGAGWLLGAANLVMTASDLARWDIGLLDRSLLHPASYTAQFAPMRLNDGTATAYGLGLDIEQVEGRLRIGHAGGGSGFLADNRLWPTERTAVAVLTNNDWASPGELGERIAFLVVPPTAAAARARAVFEALQHGTLDRSAFTAVGNSYWSAAIVDELRASLAPLGPLRLLQLQSESRRGGLTTRRWKILCAHARLEAVERSLPGGAIEQFLISQRQD